MPAFSPPPLHCQPPAPRPPTHVYIYGFDHLVKVQSKFFRPNFRYMLPGSPTSFAIAETILPCSIQSLVVRAPF